MARLLSAICLIWAGMVLGISFLETPAKFRAPSLTLPVALDVGRAVFGAFEKAQLGLGVVTVLVALWSRPRVGTVVACALAVTVTLVEALWLRPILDARVSVLLGGGTPPPSGHHTAFVALEAVKVLALIAAATFGLRRPPG
jgi:hypothetical protein